MITRRLRTYFTALYIVMFSGVGSILLCLLVFAIWRGKDLWSYTISIGLILAYFIRAASYDESAIKEAKTKCLTPQSNNQRFDIVLWLLAYIITISPYLRFEGSQVYLTNSFMTIFALLIYLSLWLLRPQTLLKNISH